MTIYVHVYYIKKKKNLKPGYDVSSITTIKSVTNYEFLTRGCCRYKVERNTGLLSQTISSEQMRIASYYDVFVVEIDCFRHY